MLLVLVLVVVVLVVLLMLMLMLLVVVLEVVLLLVVLLVVVLLLVLVLVLLPLLMLLVLCCCHCCCCCWSFVSLLTHWQLLTSTSLCALTFLGLPVPPPPASCGAPGRLVLPPVGPGTAEASCSHVCGRLRGFG
jgi:hypothetical protein